MKIGELIRDLEKVRNVLGGDADIVIEIDNEYGTYDRYLDIEVRLNEDGKGYMFIETEEEPSLVFKKTIEAEDENGFLDYKTIEISYEEALEYVKEVRDDKVQEVQG